MTGPTPDDIRQAATVSTYPELMNIQHPPARGEIPPHCPSCGWQLHPPAAWLIGDL